MPDAETSPWADPDWRAVLFYVFKGIAAEPVAPRRLLVRDLLFPPLLVVPELWTRGYVRFLENRRFEKRERLPVHCFEYHGRVAPTFIDERGKVLEHRTEPCGMAGMTLVRGVDERIASALGLSPASSNETTASQPIDVQSRRVSRRAGSIVLHLPDSGKTSLDWSRLEEKLIEAVELARAGEWTGHGNDLETRMFDIRFESRNCKKLGDVLGTAIRGLPESLPSGWYATVCYAGSGEEKIEL